ncbi:MAG TPA: PEP-CTERM sorting domain-containing protein [Bryobacteraceae bacterium]
MKIGLCAFVVSAAVCVPSLLSASAIDTTFNVSFDTTSLEGAGPFELAFLLTDGNGVGDGNTTVTLNNFQFGFGGSAGSQTLDSTGGVSGSLAASVTLTDTTFFNLFGSEFLAGNDLAFQVGIVSSTLDSPTPDLFQVVILDSFGNPLPTSDPSGQDSLLIDTLDSSSPVAQLYTLPSTVPEPGSLGLFLAAGCVTGLLHRKLRKS